MSRVKNYRPIRLLSKPTLRGSRAVTFFLALGFCAALLLFNFPASDSPIPATTQNAFSLSALLDQQFAPVPPDLSVSHPVYPYSVIPGGARNPRELREALSRDAVAANHYADFNVRSAFPTRLPVSRAAYVSYRRGSQIYWTSKKISLPAGELVLCDGKNMVRGRCGNRISDVPRQPTAPYEPTPSTLATPIVPPRVAMSPEDLPDDAQFDLSPITPMVVAFNPVTSSSEVPRNGIFIPPIYCCLFPGAHNPTPATPPFPAPPPIIPGPPAGIPEPPSGFLLAIGLVGILVLLITHPRD